MAERQRANLAALVRKCLLDSEELKSTLTTYGNGTAVFYQKAPDDTDPAWNQCSQYPRLVFLIDSRQEAEHNRSGELTVDIICSQTGENPETIQPMVHERLAGAIFTPAGHAPTILKWRDASTFEEGPPAALLLGITVTFDIIDLPDMTTTEPDPVAALYEYIRQWDPDVLTIGGRHMMPDYFKPERGCPAVWARVATSSVDRITNTVTWINATLAVHLFAPRLETRTSWLHQLADELAAIGEVIAEDGAPMFIQNIRGDAAADEFVGQLKIGLQYGVQRIRDDIPRPIQKTGVSITYKE